MGEIKNVIVENPLKSLKNILESQGNAQDVPNAKDAQDVPDKKFSKNCNIENLYMDKYNLVICPKCSRHSFTSSAKRLIRCNYIYCSYQFDNPHNIYIKNNTSLFKMYGDQPIKNDN